MDMVASSHRVHFGIFEEGALPKEMLRDMREKGFFNNDEEPSKMQLYNKISHLKKLFNLTE